MDPEDVKDADTSNPIFEMDEKRIMPLHMFIADVEFSVPLIGKDDINFMAVVSHLKKTDRLQITGRLRFEKTGNKTALRYKSDFALSELPKAKQEIRDMYQKMQKEIGFIETKAPREINFEVGESFESTMSKINKSNEFNIGVIPQEE